MQDLTICGLDRLQSALEAQPDLVISITDPGDGYDTERTNHALEGYDGKIIHLEFHDVERLDNNSVAPSLPMARNLLKDIQSVEHPSHVLVHCGMGMRRSPAIAMLAVGALTDQDQPSSVRAENIFKKVFEAAPHAEPNKRMVEITDLVLDLDAELVGQLYDREKTPAAGSKLKRTKTKRRFRV